MLSKCQAIVINTVNYSETSVVLKCFTDLYGIQSYMVNGVRSKKGAIRPSQLMPLTLLEIEAYHQQDKNLQRIKELKCTPALRSIHFDVFKSAVAIFMAEIIYKSIKEENHVDMPLFTFLHSSIQLLDLHTEKLSNYPIYFLLQLSRYLGFQPKGKFSPTTNGFDFKEGIFEAYHSQNPYQLEPISSELLSSIIESNASNFHSTTIAPEIRPQLLNCLIEYYQTHVDGFREINSHKILTAVLA